MKPDRSRTAAAIAGYGLGVGLCFVALVGVPLRFAFPNASSAVIYLGSLAAGVVVGALWASWRGVEL